MVRLRALEDEAVAQLVAPGVLPRPLTRLDLGENEPLSDAALTAVGEALAAGHVRVRETLIVGGPKVSKAAQEALAKTWKSSKAAAAAAAQGPAEEEAANAKRGKGFQMHAALHASSANHPVERKK